MTMLSKYTEIIVSIKNKVDGFLYAIKSEIFSIYALI
jgi:hypothetical protein